MNFKKDEIKKLCHALATVLDLAESIVPSQDSKERKKQDDAIEMVDKFLGRLRAENPLDKVNKRE